MTVEWKSLLVLFSGSDVVNSFGGSLELFFCFLDRWLMGRPLFCLDVTFLKAAEVSQLCWLLLLKRDCPFLFVESTTAKGKWSFPSRK